LLPRVLAAATFVSPQDVAGHQVRAERDIQAKEKAP
jgi:hypothetical protein